ncbi:hypothetical protein LFZ31_22300, partial [Salmonella enterica subsp. enterica serovar Newport str. S09097]
VGERGYSAYEMTRAGGAFRQLAAHMPEIPRADLALALGDVVAGTIMRANGLCRRIYLYAADGIGGVNGDRACP